MAPSNTRNSGHLLGQKGEEAAASYLEALGCKILARNWRSWPYEIDLVCQDKEEIVFVEVKTRKSDNFGGPASAVSPHKKQSLIAGAKSWLSSFDHWDKACRFDVIALIFENNIWKLEHFRNAIQFSHIVDSGDSTWQPW